MNFYRKLEFLSAALLLLFFILTLIEVESLEVPCEKSVNYNWTHSGQRKTCFMASSTKIDARGTTVTKMKDDSVTALRMYGNKKIKFLPLNLDKVIPNLTAYSASHCTIKTIAKENFKKLNKLRELHLRDNLIEKIYGDTFEDLIILEELNLRK